MNKYILLFTIILLTASCKKEIAALKTAKSALTYTLVEVVPLVSSNEPITINSIGHVSSDKELKFSNSSPLGWIWTSDRFFPWVYSYSLNDWIYFDTATTPVRVYSSRSAEWTILKQ